MSIFEMLLVCIVSLFVLKTDDIPNIILQLKRLNHFSKTIQQDALQYIKSITFETQTNNSLSSNTECDIEQINFYITKIQELDSEFSGDYCLKSVKQYYQELMNKKLNYNFKDHVK